MAIVPTLNTFKSFTAQVGNPTVQPTPNAANYGPLIASTTSTSTFNKGTYSVSEGSIRNITGLTFESGQLVRTTNPSLSTLVSAVTTNPKFVMPGLTSGINKILPSYLTQYQPRFVHRPESSDSMKGTSRKFEPYEILTGISHERPEIVMMLPFVPLFLDESSHSKPAYLDIVESSGINFSLSDAGMYVDLQMNSRNLLMSNMRRDMNKLGIRNSGIKNAFSARKKSVEKNIDALQDISQWLLDLVQKAEMIQNQLDLRDDIHTVQVIKSATSFASAYSRVSIATLQTYTNRFIQPTYSLPDTLSRFGFATKNIKEIFSSSKIWLQMLLEYKHLLIAHSSEFLDIETVAQRNDKSPTTLVRSQTPVFTLAPDDPVGIGSVETIAKTTVSELKTLLTTLKNAFQTIYKKGAHFKSEEARIAALANILSKEHKFSSGLNDEPVRRALADYYGFSTNVDGRGNLTMFDDFVGKFGQNVSEFPAVNKNSVASIAQQQPDDNVAVLTFESKYLEGDDGTLTPGSTWYVDPVFRTDGKDFDTSTLTSLGALMRRSHYNFSTVVNGLNVMSVLDADLLSRNSNSISTYLDNPSELLKYLLKSIVDKTGHALPSIKNDRLTSVFVMAQQNVSIKSMLFVHLMNRMLRSTESSINFDNAAVTQTLVSNLLQQVEASVKESSTAFQIVKSQGVFVDSNDVDADSIRNALKQGTTLLTFVENTLTQIFLALQQVSKNDRLIYSGQFDTVLMMVAFDMIVALVAKYGNQRIVSKKTSGKSGNKKTTFIVAKSNLVQKNSVNNMTTRLDREIALTHQVTYSILNTLKAVGDSVEGLANYLKSPKSKTHLTSISTIIPDVNLLQMLFSEHQIMMLGSGIADIAGKFKKGVSSYVDVDRDGDFDSNDEVKLLDDSIISPKLRTAFMGTFRSPNFIGSPAYNKRIITVGVPLGFTRRLKQLVSQKDLKKTSFANKQNDIVQVVVYKVDLINQDIVYKPLRFLFEMSRFPVRDDAHYKQLKANPTFEEIANAIPTRDWQEAFQDGSQAVAYWNSNQTGQKNTKNALDASSYDFLSVKQKAEIVRNHIMSHMLEMYVKLTTGVSVSEQSFDIVERPRSVETEFVKLLGDHQVQHVADYTKFLAPVPANLGGALSLTGFKPSTKDSAPVGGILFSSTLRSSLPSVSSAFFKHSTVSFPKTTTAAGVAGQITPASFAQTIENPPALTTLVSQTKTPFGTATNLNSISHRFVPAVLSSLKSLHTLTKAQTTISDGSLIAKQMLTPKQFDRVFNVIIDPDDFEIDYGLTTASKFGVESLRNMIRRGDVIPQASANAKFEALFPSAKPGFKGSVDPNINNFKLRSRNKTEGDLIFEKYFVTIETFGEGTV